MFTVRGRRGQPGPKQGIDAGFIAPQQDVRLRTPQVLHGGTKLSALCLLGREVGLSDGVHDEVSRPEDDSI